jgi:nucleotide-binding universal stress UspA family protein
MSDTVLTAGAETDSRRPVLIAYDGSAHARAASLRAGALLRPRAAAGACVWTPIESRAAALVALPASVADAGARAIDAASRDEAERLAQEGAELARGAGLDADSRALEGVGPAWSAIVRFADEIDAAVVVTGTRGRSPLAAAVLGSTAQGVLSHARRPVLIVADDGGTRAA